MAGIDWFRWHHGSVTDPKFALVARKACARLGDVIAVWAFVLEQASASDERGSVGDLDAESIDCLLGADDGTTARILDAMEARGLIAGRRVASWDKRQPKREDETAAERKRRQREREHEIAISQRTDKAAVTEEASRTVTHESRDVTRCHDRGEERREEKEIPPLPPDGGSPPLDPEPEKPAKPPRACRLPGDWEPGDEGEAFARASGLTADRIASEAAKFRDYWVAKPGKDATKADWPATWRNWVRKAVETVPAAPRQSRDAEPEWRRIERERNEAFLGPAAARARNAKQAAGARSSGAPLPAYHPTREIAPAARETALAGLFSGDVIDMETL